MSMVPVLQTARLTLRGLKESDVNEIYMLRSDDVVNRFVDRQRAAGPADALAFIRKIEFLTSNRQTFYWGLTLKDNDSLIGTITLWNFNKEKNIAELGYELLPQYHRKGYMREALQTVIRFAFADLRLAAIEGWTHPDNAASTNVLKALGFERDEEAEKTKPPEAIEFIYTLTPDKLL